MIKTMIVSVLMSGAAGGGFAAMGGQLPALPTATPPAAAAPAPAGAGGGFQVIATCDDGQDSSQAGGQAAKTPGQARKGSPRTVTVQVPQAPQSAAQSVPQSAPDAAHPQPPTAAPSAAAPAAAPAAPDKLNSADRAALIAMPGIAEKTADKILQARAAHPGTPVTSDEVAHMPGVTAPHAAEIKAANGG